MEIHSSEAPSVHKPDVRRVQRSRKLNMKANFFLLKKTGFPVKMQTLKAHDCISWNVICLAQRKKKNCEKTGINHSRMSRILFYCHSIRDSRNQQTDIMKKWRKVLKSEKKIEFTKRLKPDHKSPAYTRSVYCYRSEKWRCREQLFSLFAAS